MKIKGLKTAIGDYKRANKEEKRKEKRKRLSEMLIIHFRRLQSLDPFVSHFTKRGEELTGKLLYKNMDATCLEIHTSLAVKCGNIKR